MNLSVAAVLAALFWSAAAGVGTWLVLLPVRRRWLTGLFASVVLSATAASLGALAGGISTMVLPLHEWMPIALLTIGAGMIATVIGAAAARRLAYDNRVLRRAVAELAEGRVPSGDGRPLTAELEQLRRELSRTASDLAATRDRERALESARRELVSWVSHDLRTPLAGLRATSEALEDGLVEDPQPYYKQIVLAVDRLSGMVEDLFDLSRIQAGASPRGSEPVVIDDMVSDVVAALDPLASAKRIRLAGSGGHGIVVRGDSAQLERALTNLVANAVRHTPEDGTVSVDATARDQGVAIVVQDACGGIAPEDLVRVFDVGFRGDAARSRDGGAGAGLGLAITRGIVEAHHGTVEVANAAAGCRFVLTLPAS